MESMGDLLKDKEKQMSICKKSKREGTAQSWTKTSTSSCPYGKCDGKGIIVREDGWAGTLCKCRDDKIMESKLEFANMPEEFRSLKISEFKTNLYDSPEGRSKAEAARRAAAKFVKEYDAFKEKGKGLYLYSYTKGSGKTRLAASIGNALVSVHRARVKFVTTLDLLDEIKATYSRESAMSENKLLEAVRSVDVLILDDIGVEEPTNWVKEKLYNILNSRMDNKKVTIFTSNSTVSELGHDDRIKSRIEKMAFPVYMPDESIRSSLAKKENDELMDILFG